MDALKLDFLSDGRKRWPGYLALTVGLSAILLVAWRYQDENRKVFQLEKLVASVRSERLSRLAPLPVEKNSEQTALETAQAKAIILELNLPWKDLFEAIESYRKDDIAVLSIEPDAQKGLVRINVEAKSLDSVTAYMIYLQKIPLFRDVELVSHQIQEQDPQQPVRLMLQASWGPRS